MRGRRVFRNYPTAYDAAEKVSEAVSKRRLDAHTGDAANQGRVGAPTAWPFVTRSSRPHSANRRACGGRGAAPPLRRVRAPTRA